MKTETNRERPYVTNWPDVNYYQEGLNLFIRDRRKVIGAGAVLILPLLNELWRFAPLELEIAYYQSFQIFLWNFCLNLTLVIVSTAWYLSLPRTDVVLHRISLLAIGYGVYLTLDTLPFSDETPFWVDLSITAGMLFCIATCLRYVQRHYLSQAENYKELHDGLVHDLHHRRFLGVVDRIAGTLEVSQIDAASKQICLDEIKKLKESVAYISEKYSELH